MDFDKSLDEDFCSEQPESRGVVLKGWAATGGVDGGVENSMSSENSKLNALFAARTPETASRSFAFSARQPRKSVIV
jgi:hypothetical protein